MYNSLPVELKDSTSLEIFKKNLKTHIFRKSYDATYDATVNDAYRVLWLHKDAFNNHETIIIMCIVYFDVCVLCIHVFDVFSNVI